MRLDSVRELKRTLPLHLERKIVARARASALASPAVAIAASRRRNAPSYFLGVTEGKKGYRLAVRLQDRALEKSALVAEISAQAKGEVDVRYVGKIRARRSGHPWYRSKQRPLLLGTSVGFVGADDYVMAGTLGCFVRKGNSNALYILSNNHVLADENRYKKGGAILQPGELDGGTRRSSWVAKLSDYVALDGKGTNYVDCAIAKLRPGIQADTATLKGIGTLTGLRSHNLDAKDHVHKVGRTTGVRHGRVTAVELDDVSIEYDMGDVSFDDQIEIEGAGDRSFDESGDSGSLIVDDDGKAAALLFAGGDHGGRNGQGVTYANPIRAVLSALKIKIVH